MAANATKDRAAKAKEKEREAKRKDKEREAKRKEKEKAAKAKEKEKAAKAKEKASRQKEKEREAKRKDKEREAKRKEKEKAARAKEKAKKASTKDKARAAKDKPARQRQRADPEQTTDGQVVQPVEEVAVADRGETVDVEDAPGAQQESTGADAPSAGPARTGDEPTQSPAAQLEPLPENDKTVRPKGYIAEALGKEDLVGRSTQRATIAASYTTRDHDIIRAWAESRGGLPADVAGTGRRGAGVLRIEFPDGPRDDSALEDVDWTSFFATFDDSDVDFLYQERVRTGAVSRFHKFVRPDA